LRSNFSAMNGDSDRKTLIELLAWYGELGADCTLSEFPVNWLQHSDRVPGEAVRQALRMRAERPEADRGLRQSDSTSTARATTKAQQSPVSAPSRPPTVQSAASRRVTSSEPGGEAGSAPAGRIAAAAKSLEELRASLESFEGCALRATAKNTCFFRGAPKSPLMIIGEAPGRDEDREGLPFVGRAGKLLDRMLQAIGLCEGDVHITNVVYWRPPGNRTPTLQETDACRPFLERQAQLVEPEYILLLGGAAAKSVLDTSDGIMRCAASGRSLRSADALCERCRHCTLRICYVRRQQSVRLGGIY
jgi:uracil-DNA glycosylase